MCKIRPDLLIYLQVSADILFILLLNNCCLSLLQFTKKAGKNPAIPEIYIFNAKKSLGRHVVERGRDIFYIESSVPVA